MFAKDLRKSQKRSESNVIAWFNGTYRDSRLNAPPERRHVQKAAHSLPEVPIVPHHEFSLISAGTDAEKMLIAIVEASDKIMPSSECACLKCSGKEWNFLLQYEECLGKLHIAEHG